MEIRFKDKKLRKQYEKRAEVQKAYPHPVGDKLIERCTLLKAVKELEDLRAFPQLRWHPLKGDRQGQYAIVLHAQWRLIFTLDPEDEQIILILEVSNHYDD